MKIYKGWIGNHPAYWVVEKTNVKCIDCLVRNEYIIANTEVKSEWLAKKFDEASWLEVLAVTGITKGQVEKVFKEEPELRSSFACPRPNKERL